MANVKTCQYGVDGRMGSYVYLFICVDDGRFIVKVGVSDFPSERLMTIRLGCPFKPKTFATMRTPTRKAAFAIEHQLLLRLKEHKTRGEWLKFMPEDKAVFASACEAIVSKYRSSAYPMKWDQVQMSAFERGLEQLKRFGKKSGYLPLKEYKSFERGLAGADTE